MANLIYTHPDENMTSDVTWSLTSGTEDPNYPLTNLSDGIHAKPYKTASGTVATIVATFSGSQAIQLVALGPHNLAGATVKLDNNGGMTQQSIVIPANRSDGQSVNPWLDLSAVDNITASIWTFTFTAASAPPAIGEIEMYFQKRALVHNPRYGFRDEEAHAIIEHQTDYGISKPPYDLGVTKRTLRDLSVIGKVADIAQIQAWHRACYGRAKSCLVVLDPAVNDARFVRFLEPNWYTVLSYPAVHETTFSLEEVNRGPVL